VLDQRYSGKTNDDSADAEQQQQSKGLMELLLCVALEPYKVHADPPFGESHQIDDHGGCGRENAIVSRPNHPRQQRDAHEPDPRTGRQPEGEVSASA
jgi:hypothetical protein